MNDPGFNFDYRWLDDAGEAFGAPGLEPRWTSSQKDAIGTAYAVGSRVWYTVSHGTLNEVYYPTIDRPQMRDMELLFTDEETFVHEEKRDLDYNFSYLGPNVPACRMVANDPQGRYTVTKEIFSDPHHPVVLMHIRLDGDEAVLNKLKCYALMAPHLDGGGAGNNARSVDVAGRRVVLAWKNSMSLAMGASCGFSRSSCGFVGKSDGYQDLTAHGKMEWQFGKALNGNIACMGEVVVDKHREFTIALSFGLGHHAAVSAMVQNLSGSFEQQRARFIDQWHRAAPPMQFDSVSGDQGQLSRTSHSIILTHEDKTFAGAFIASASIPWGASKSDADLGGYHLVWTRDMVQSATALLACGRTENALRALVYLACTQRADGGFAQNFWVDGTAYWTGIQLDEVAFPIILAWRLWKLNGLGHFDVLPFVERAASFLCKYAPVTQQERWEENAGYSPSTLAAVIAALICAADLSRGYGSADLGAFFETYADWIEAHLDDWTTTDDDKLLPGVKTHYMRIRPPGPGEPFYNPNIPAGFIHLANREPGEQADFDAREIIDAGFLELVRYGIRRPDDPLVTESLKVVDHVLKCETVDGPVWRRYNHDGYGQKKSGAPYDGSGQGRAWPLLLGERAHYELAAGNDIKPLIATYERYASVGGMLPEQVWDRPDMPSQGMYNGRSAGSAQPLVWAHAEYLKLLRSAADGAVFDRIPVVAERYAVAPGDRSFQSRIEIFHLTRPVRQIQAGNTLRIFDPHSFGVVFSFDDWHTVHNAKAVRTGHWGSFVDIETPAGAAPGSRLTFTMHWPEDAADPDHWLGYNVDVEFTAHKP